MAFNNLAPYDNEETSVLGGFMFHPYLNANYGGWKPSWTI
jgi:hypothetical protein